MYRFVLSRRWIAFAVFVVLLTATMVRLGVWQWTKGEHRAEQNVQIAKHLSADPVQLDDVVVAGDDVPAELEWTRVTVTGVFDTDAQVSVRYAQRDGQPGVDVVTPLVLSDGTAILVDRGWMRTANNGTKPEALPNPDPGTVTIEGWLRRNSDAPDRAVVPVDGQVRAIDSRAWSEATDLELRSGFINAQSPEQVGLVAEPQPELGTGPHKFYGIQWWFFAALAFFGLFWFARAEAIERRQAAERSERRPQASETKSA